MRELIDDLKSTKLAIFDLDGVIYRGKELIANADDVVQSLKDLSIKVIYNSNNSTITRHMYVERLKDFGIPSEITDFYTSASITASWDSWVGSGRTSSSPCASRNPSPRSPDRASSSSRSSPTSSSA